MNVCDAFVLAPGGHHPDPWTLRPLNSAHMKACRGPVRALFVNLAWLEATCGFPARIHVGFHPQSPCKFPGVDLEQA